MKKYFTILSLCLMLAACGHKAPVADNAPAPEGTAISTSEPAESYDLEGIAKAIAGCTYIGHFENGVALVQKEGERFYINKMGNRVEASLPAVKEAELTAKYDGDSQLRGFVDKAGNWVIRPQFEYCGDFHEGRAWVCTPESMGGIGFIDETGALVTPCDYEWAVDHQPCDFHEGLCPVMVDGSHEWFGYIDRDGNRAFPGVYSYEADFSEGLAGVTEILLNEGEYAGVQDGYIDHTGKMVIKADYENAFCGAFHDGVARISKYDQPTYFIDKTGKRLFEISPDDYYTGDEIRFSEGLAVVHHKTKGYCFLDKQGHSTLDYNVEP